MTWHLKDRALEEKLNELVGNNQFTEALNHECISIQSKKVIVVKFGENTGHVKGSFRCYFAKDELTNIGYDPKSWNEFPMVTPPSRVMMQIEYDRDFGIGNMKVRVIGIYSELRKCWFMFDPNSDEGLTHLGCPIRRIGIYENLRFRPLED